MFFILSKVLDFLLSPIVWIVLLFLTGLIIKKPVLKKRFIYSGVILLLIFSNPFLASEAFRAWEGEPQALRSVGDYDMGIVLTGVAFNRSSAPDRVFFSKGADRVLHTVQLYKTGKIKNVLISGGSGAIRGKKVSEAMLLKKVFLYSGVPDSAISVEGNSRNTVESARYCRKFIHSLRVRPKILLVTSAFHMQRSIGCFKKAGIVVDGYSTDFMGDKVLNIRDLIFPRESALSNWSVLIHEIAGYFVYKLMGYV